MSLIVLSFLAASTLSAQLQIQLGQRTEGDRQPQEQRREHSRYFQALDDLRGARWMLDRRPGNWAQSREEIATIRKIDDAINEIRGASFDDRRDNDYHPVFDREENDRPGRMRHAEQLILRAREDIREAENDGQYRGLRDRTMRHLDEALTDVRRVGR
jgi:hypothetical protein